MPPSLSVYFSSDAHYIHLLISITARAHSSSTKLHPIVLLGPSLWRALRCFERLIFIILTLKRLQNSSAVDCLAMYSTETNIFFLLFNSASCRCQHFVSLLHITHVVHQHADRRLITKASFRAAACHLLIFPCLFLLCK